MQWLIDIVKEWTVAQKYLTASYVERPSENVYDYTFAMLTTDDAWHELDFSSVVPEGATAINFHIKAAADIIGAVVFIRKQGYPHDKATCRLRIQVANQVIQIPVIVGVGPARIIEYRIMPATWSGPADITVKGWWL